MFIDGLLKRLTSHISSVAIALLLLIIYIMDGSPFLDPYLPVNGKPLVVFMLLSIVILWELITKGQKSVDGRIDHLGTQLEEHRLVSSVNGVYGRFLSSGDEFIDNEWTIKELAQLKDTRERLGINSYTQGRLEFLESKIKRTI